MADGGVYTAEHEAFRDQVKRFIAREITPYHDNWEKAGEIDRDLWHKMGAAGLLCCAVPEEYGGPGADFSYSAVVLEELAKANASGPGVGVHSDIVTPYILHYGSDEQKQEWLPKLVSGEAVGAIAMTEPGTGSDLQGVRTSAIEDGNHLVVNGAKTFITNGQQADVIIVVAKTDPSQGAHGTSLVLVEREREGFSRGRNLEKIGLKAQDTSELFFDNVRVPKTNLLGEEGRGFEYLMSDLPQERLIIALGAVAHAEAGLDWTIEYVKGRKAFGKAIGDFQNTRFRLADVKTEVTIGRAFVEQCLEKHMNGGLDPTTAAMAKLWTTEMENRVLDICLQLHGGYGYMWEYPIARAWADARIARIYGGTNEIMRELIGRSL
ncbi:MAG: acyl-CoA dehydrogenase family protein [Alphaproteobacteria bacterium]|jgi:acyl-CoA dehydrogenase|nr:acyl-CoA dehydrogenase family protein [Alphaproteobacteria bacterium]MDP6238351.1 acyl-CoA dehydrogenase family protein [Alphaproteobacteria bacterium]MDP7173510.1 acyl-CoA dehydrogenase family protein [Alphaproteobacteria bacterium]MDP7232699.1 acyl-CoA dehydrogenase family protein [Alphaproteobacteria bacterium]|tara:strand:+ start:2229 stop:3365 length:1137 start_codon:yes stop_codon:yes gene_type:complete